MTVDAGVYVRISADTRRDGLGVERQRKDCIALADRLGWHVAQVYVENDTSASNGSPRPEYAKLMAAVEQKRIGAVVVWDVDRLTRSPRELEDVIDFADRVGLKLASAGGDIDLATVQGRMMARMKGTLARYEIEQMTRRMRRKHSEMAANGRHNGPRPFGWDLTRHGSGEPVTLTINTAEAAIVRESVGRVLAGETLWKISNGLNARAICTATGGPWQTTTLRQMVLRWRNCGIRTHKGKEAGIGQWEPIIDRDTHERVVAKLTDPSRRSNNRGTAVKYLLTSRAFCGVCGRHVVGAVEFRTRIKKPLRVGETEPRYGERVYPDRYKCPHAGCHGVTRAMADVDELVEGVIVGVLERDGVRLLGGDPVAAGQARERIDALEAKLAIAADKFADDVFTGDQLRRINERIRPQLSAEHDRLRKAQPDDGMKGFAGNGVAKAWVAADVETKRAVLAVLPMRVTILPIGVGMGHTPIDESVRIEWESKP